MLTVSLKDSSSGTDRFIIGLTFFSLLPLTYAFEIVDGVAVNHVVIAYV